MACKYKTSAGYVKARYKNNNINNNSNKNKNEYI